MLGNADCRLGTLLEGKSCALFMAMIGLEFSTSLMMSLESGVRRIASTIRFRMMRT